MQMLFYAHSGLRYLVLLAGLAALVYYLVAMRSKEGDTRAGRILGAVFVGSLDLQILLGILMVALGLFYSALIGHMFMMVAAAVVAHVARAMARGSANPSRANSIRILGVALALILIVGGIMAIGRSVFGSGSPTLL